MPVDGSAPLSRSALLRYAAMACPLSIGGIPVYLHAPDFYARTLDVSLASLGAWLLVLRAVDALQDPLIGICSDRFSNWRSMVVAIGASLLGLGFWMIFHPLASHALPWLAASILVCTTGFSIVTINLQALGGLWRAGPHERTRIAGWREGIGLAGLLAGAALPGLFGSATDAPRAFHLLALAYLPILGAGLLLLMHWMQSAPLDQPPSHRPPQGWQNIFRSRWRRQFFLICFVNGLANAVPAVLVIFFIRDLLGAEDRTGLFLALYFLSGAVAMPLWHRVAVGLGKFRCWAISMVLAVATFAWALALGPGEREAFAAICILSGMALGADLSLPPSILADHIARHGEQASAARYFSVMAFIAKASLALATGTVLPALGMLGFEPGVPAGDTSLTYLGVAYAGLPSLLKLVVACWLWRSLALLQSLGDAGNDRIAAPVP